MSALQYAARDGRLESVKVLLAAAVIFVASLSTLEVIGAEFVPKEDRAEFVVMVCGDIMTMPGLPKVPSAEKIDLTDDGKVVGLF